ncbi:MAG: alginate export family protein [Alphaproteobacteria bacterium]
MYKSNFIKALLVSSAIFSINPAFAGDDVKSIVTDGDFFGQVRYRYEFVEQDGINEDARASTIRTNIGFKTGKYKNFQALVEGQLVHTFGAEDFNDTTNGKTKFPVVADPDTAEINQLWLSWSGLPATQITAGRQGINLDNQRFVGTVGWRQNDQTFDSVLLTNSSIPDLSLAYSYVWNVNRINGDDHAFGDLDTTTHVAHATYNATDWLNVTGYGYWLDIDLDPSSSSKTYGIRLNGDTAINDDWKLFYEAEVATQSDHADNTSSYDEEYYHISPGISGHGLTLQAGYEVLGGDGTDSFQTPLATGHKFNGWADKFLSTPANGLEDAYVKASYKFSNVNEYVDGTSITAVYHEFDGNETGDYGSEIDLAVKKSFTLPKGQPFEKLNFVVKYADYNADDAPYTDTQKLWFQVGVNF